MQANDGNDGRPAAASAITREPFSVSNARR
jgi:hypothetical protein